VSYTLIVTPAAAADLTAIRNWYEQQAEGLGDRFLERVGDALTVPRSSPFLYEEVRPGVHRVPLAKFPYVIVYRIRRQTVRLIAVYHVRRDETPFADRN
jgi:plasmid stabilization system protein ParE